MNTSLHVSAYLLSIGSFSSLHMLIIVLVKVLWCLPFDFKGIVFKMRIYGVVKAGTL